MHFCHNSKFEASVQLLKQLGWPAELWPISRRDSTTLLKSISGAHQLHFGFCLSANLSIFAKNLFPPILWHSLIAPDCTSPPNKWSNHSNGNYLWKDFFSLVQFAILCQSIWIKYELQYLDLLIIYPFFCFYKPCFRCIQMYKEVWLIL